MQMKFISTCGQVNNIDISLKTTTIIKIFSETNILVYEQVLIIDMFPASYGSLDMGLTSESQLIKRSSHLISYDSVWYKFSAGVLFIPVL